MSGDPRHQRGLHNQRHPRGLLDPRDPASPAGARIPASLAGAGGGASGLAELYGEMILDHNRRPRNFGRLAAASHSAQGHNPLCGDRVAVYLRLAEDRIEEIAFEGAGCAISTASASMMTEALRGKSVAEAQRLFQVFHGLLTAGSAAAPEGSFPAAAAMELGKLEAFAGVREFPMRVKCATLAWHALQQALGSPLGASEGAAPGTVPAPAGLPPAGEVR